MLRPLLVATAICIVSAGLASAQILPRQGGATAAPMPSEKSDASPDQAACALVKVTANELDPNGIVWDRPITGQQPPPDLRMTEATTGASAACDNSFTCFLEVSPAPDTLSITILDDDSPWGAEEVGKGQCGVGETCVFAGSSVKVTDC